MFIFKKPWTKGFCQKIQFLISSALQSKILGMFAESVIPKRCKIFQVWGYDQEIVFASRMPVNLGLSLLFRANRDRVDKFILGNVGLDKLEPLHLGLWISLYLKNTEM